VLSNLNVFVLLPSAEIVPALYHIIVAARMIICVLVVGSHSITTSSTPITVEKTEAFGTFPDFLD